MALFAPRCTAKRRELETAFRLQVGVEIEKRRAGRQRVPKGVIADLARKFNVAAVTIKRVGRRFRDEVSNPKGMNLSRRRKGRCGPHKIPLESVAAKIKTIPPCKRRTIRVVAELTKIPKSTLHRKMAELGCRRANRWIHPMLIRKQRVDRVRWITNQITTDGRRPSFKDCRYTVHLDEKWFYAMKDGAKTWLLPTDDRQPPPRVQNKGSIPKVMFLAAVGRPHYRPDGSRFNGLVGIWPFVEETLAARSSKNRGRGAVEIKTINVTGEVFRDVMVNEVIPSIQRAFWHAKKKIVLQLDGARVHWKSSIQGELRHALHAGGFKMTVIKQPANSPDLNVLDLGFFHSLQGRSDAIKFGGRLMDIITSVAIAFRDYPPMTLEHVWQSLFAVMECVVETEGGNAFPLPHLGKERAEKRGALEWAVPVKRGLLAHANRFLRGVSGME